MIVVMKQDHIQNPGMITFCLRLARVPRSWILRGIRIFEDRNDFIDVQVHHRFPRGTSIDSRMHILASVCYLYRNQKGIVYNE